MWKHEILETFEKESNISTKTFLQYVRQQLLASHQFFIDGMEKVRENIKTITKELQNKELCFASAPMPYNSTLLCCKIYNKYKSAQLFCPHPDIPKLNVIFSFIGIESVADGKKGAWVLVPGCIVVEESGASKIGLISKEDKEDFKAELNHSGSRLFALSKIISCKNISAETIKPPEKVNKKRIKNGKLPLYSYHVLNISPFGSKKNGQTNEQSSNLHRLHFCRGHFKEYTAEKPLFGRITGLYWWQPTLRGNKDLGFVDKDYNVDVKKYDPTGERL